jgi:hypothetical protein
MHEVIPVLRVERIARDLHVRTALQATLDEPIWNECEPEPAFRRRDHHLHRGQLNHLVGRAVQRPCHAMRRLRGLRKVSVSMQISPLPPARVTHRGDSDRGVTCAIAAQYQRPAGHPGAPARPEPRRRELKNEAA